MNPNEDQNQNMSPQGNQGQGNPVPPPVGQPPMTQMPPAGMPIAPMATAGVVAGTAAGTSIVTWVIIAVTSVVLVGGGVGGYVYYQKNYGDVSTIKINTFSDDKNVSLIQENLGAFLEAQKGRDAEGVAKYLPQELKDELTVEYLDSYFTESEENITQTEIKEVGFDPVNFDKLALDLSSYPDENKALVTLDLTRDTSYLGNETRAVYEVPMVYRKKWEVVATDGLIPKKLKTVTASGVVNTMAEKDLFLNAGEVSVATEFTKVAVFDTHIVLKANYDIKTPDSSGRTPVLSLFSNTIVDDTGQTYDYQDSDDRYPTNTTSSIYMVNGKSSVWFSFAPPKEQTVSNNIKNLTFQYSFGVPNVPTVGKSFDASGESIEIDLE